MAFSNIRDELEEKPLHNVIARASDKMYKKFEIGRHKKAVNLNFLQSFVRKTEIYFRFFEK